MLRPRPVRRHITGLAIVEVQLPAVHKLNATLARALHESPGQLNLSIFGESSWTDLIESFRDKSDQVLRIW